MRTRTLDSVTSPTAAQRAYESTKERILSGELPGGHLFSEVEVAEALGISRTPTREAFLRLQAEGFLTLLPKRGALVVPIGEREADEVLETRELLETYAVRRLAADPELRPRAVTELRTLLDAQRAAAAAEDLSSFSVADEAFHRTIVEAAGNRLLSGFYGTLRDRQRRMSAHAFGSRRNRLTAALEEHSALLGLLESGDVDAFGAALRTHLDATHRVLVGR